MKWIGQHIWDFISRFRNDVYLENVQSGTVSSGDHLGVDGDGKVVKTSGGTSGGAITVKTNGDDNNTVTTVRNDVTELVFYGADSNVKLYDNGTGSVIVDHHDSLDFAPSYGSVTSNLNSVSVNRIIGIPGSAVHNDQYYPGDWAGTKNRKTTGGDTTVTFNSNTAVSGMAGNPKVEVTVYGPQDASTSGSTNILGQDGSNDYTFLYDVDSSDTDGQSGSDRGVTVDIGSLTADGVGSALKGNINVTIDSDDTDLATIGGTFSGSQKFHSVRIRHLDNSSNELGSYTSTDSWFHDNNPTAPVAPRPDASLTANSVKRLSNIAYYGSATFTVTTSGYTNMFRDTSRYSSMGTGDDDSDNWWLIYNQFDGNATTLFNYPTKTEYKTKNDKQSAHSADLLLTAGYSVGQTNDVYAIDSSKWALNHTMQVKTKVVNDESTNTTWVVDGAYGTAYTDTSNRNYHTYTDASTNLFESQKSETFRLSGNTEATWSALNTSQNIDYWKALSVGGTSSASKSLRLDPYIVGTTKYGDYVKLTNDILPTNTTALTVAGWVRRETQETTDGLPIIFSLNSTTGTNHLLLGFGDYANSDDYSPESGKMYWWVGYMNHLGNNVYSTDQDNGVPSNDGGQMNTGSIVEALPSQSTWYHVAYVLKHAEPGNTIGNTDVLVYVDGTLTWSTEMSGEFEIPGANAGIRPYQFGQEWDGTSTAGNYFDGYLSEWGIWNSELTANEISEIASSTSPLDLTSSSGNYTSQADLKGYYKLDDDVSNSNGTITDSSSENNHGLTVQSHATVGNLSWPTEVPFTGSNQNNVDYSGRGLNTNNEHLMQGYFDSAWRLKHPMGTSFPTVAAHPSHIWTNPGNGTYEYIRFFRHDDATDVDYSSGNIKINGLHKGASTNPASGSFRHQVAAGNLEIHFMVPGTGTGQGVWVPLANDYNPGVTNQGCWMWSADNKQGVSSDYYYDINMYSSFRVILIRIKFNESFSGSIKDLTWEPNIWKNNI